MARVSVIVPAFNAGAYISETIDSALRQTHRDLEVVVVDDGSTDDTSERLRAFGDRISVYRQPNRGVAAARNHGASVASGEWLAFLDADDVWLPTKLERQLGCVRGAMIYSDRLNIGARGDLAEIQSEVTPMHEGDLFLPLLLEGNFITASSVLLRRDLFVALGGFFEPLRGTEDWDLWVRIAAAGHPIGLVREPLLQYRFHAQGISRNYAKMWPQRDRAIERALESPRGKALPRATRRKILARTWITNGWEAAQARNTSQALRAYGRSVWWWPLALQPYKELLRTLADACKA
jgi:glycosyltransferase involved in cell wall biosynthesis